MAFNDYRQAIANLATAQLAGEDIGDGISLIATETGLEPANVQQEVAEVCELFA